MNETFCFQHCLMKLATTKPKFFAPTEVMSSYTALLRLNHISGNKIITLFSSKMHIHI